MVCVVVSLQVLDKVILLAQRLYSLEVRLSNIFSRHQVKKKFVFVK